MYTFSTYFNNAVIIIVGVVVVVILLLVVVVMYVAYILILSFFISIIFNHNQIFQKIHPFKNHLNIYISYRIVPIGIIQKIFTLLE